MTDRLKHVVRFSPVAREGPTGAGPRQKLSWPIRNNLTDHVHKLYIPSYALGL